MRSFHSSLTVRLLAAAALAAMTALSGFGCSENSRRPVCLNCEGWEQVVTDLGRQPSGHPANPDYLVYSTIHKSPGATDEERFADEDLWLLWRGSSNPQQWVRWQLTGDEIGTTGDNFQARWSPSGSQIVFVHTISAGRFEIWRLGVNLPPTDPPSPDFDPRGVAERISTEGRDPAWIDESRVLFVRDNKLYQIDIAAPLRDGTNLTQLTYDPPQFVNAEAFIDRQPTVSSDGIALFSTSGREDVGDLLVAAFEIREGSPPETTATQALLGLRSPGAPLLIYPLAEGGDTLITPDDDQNPYIRLRSLPIGLDGQYEIGVQRDELFFPPNEETYCDTLLTESVTLTSGQADSLRFYFQLARGTIVATSGKGNTKITWEREDGLASGVLGVVDTPCQVHSEECLLSHQVVGGNILPNTLAPYRVIGQLNTGVRDTVLVTITPGESTFVKVFCVADSCACDSPVEIPVAFEGEWATNLASGVRGRSTDGPELRAAGSPPAIWRIDLTSPGTVSLSPVLSGRDLAGDENDESVQSPALSPPFSAGVRFLAYVSNRTGRWGLYLQKLDANLNRIGEPTFVETPGTTDNYVCDRTILQPSWVAGSSPGNLKLLVTMTGCPDNGFDDLGFDDDPWSQGELNVWEVTVPVQ